MPRLEYNNKIHLRKPMCKGMDSNQLLEVGPSGELSLTWQ
jgi:hypothetical protein